MLKKSQTPTATLSLSLTKKSFRAHCNFSASPPLLYEAELDGGVRGGFAIELRHVLSKEGPSRTGSRMGGLSPFLAFAYAWPSLDERGHQ